MALELALLLIGGGLVLYIVEAFNPGFFIAVPGTVLIVVGVVLLFFPQLFDYTLSWLGLIVLAAVTSWVTMRAYRRWAPPETSTTTPSVDNIVGQLGVADEPVSSTGGHVRVQGELWRAKSESPIATGTRVEVVGLDGNLTLKVRAADAASLSSSPAKKTKA
jgi:membrane protein implicated in regulation of membrane protease activity